MKMTNTTNQFGWFSIVNHWVTAALFIGTLALGLVLEELPKGAIKTELMGLHKSVGIAILALALVRLAWAWISPRPASPAAVSTTSTTQKTVARLVQVMLWVGLLGLPLSGWLVSVSGGHAVSFFGWFDLPMLMGRNETLHGGMEELHEALANLLIAAIALHVAGALKHHFLDRDTTLTRMLPLAVRR
jgi:cytochrome b561